MCACVNGKEKRGRLVQAKMCRPSGARKRQKDSQGFSLAVLAWTAPRPPCAIPPTKPPQNIVRRLPLGGNEDFTKYGGEDCCCERGERGGEGWLSCSKQ